MIPLPPEPDQRPERWDNHVSVYETLFEPFSLALATPALERLGDRPGATARPSVLDVGAGSGGAALALAKRGCRVTAIDASPAMAARIAQRAAEAAVSITANVMDGQALSFPSASFDAAISIFGVILFPDAVRGLAEMRRVVRPGGHVAVVTWTEPQNYELAVQLRTAIQQVRPNTLPSALPAQLRYRQRADFEALFHAAGFHTVEIETRRANLQAPSARWLGERLRFAPGMAAQLDGLGDQAAKAIDLFVSSVERVQGRGPVAFGGVAFVGTAVTPSRDVDDDGQSEGA